MHSVNVRFWGVRGSKPTPSRHTVEYGGNTACVQVQIGERTLIFDGGTGLAEFGNEMLKKQQLQQQIHSIEEPIIIDADIFFSHLHWDHIQGLPFFMPLYNKGNRFRLYGENKKSLSFQEVIETQMKPPHFPITMKFMHADYEFHEIKPGETIHLGDGIDITSFAVNHPNGCLAYRVDYGTTRVVFCTDTEPMTGVQHEEFLRFIDGADVLIYDTHYTDSEYYGSEGEPSKKGWGHSTWQEAVQISQQAHITQLVMFHHKENRTDLELRELEKCTQELFSQTVAAREGLEIVIGGDSSEKVVINYP